MFDSLNPARIPLEDSIRKLERLRVLKEQRAQLDYEIFNLEQSVYRGNTVIYRDSLSGHNPIKPWHTT